MENSKPIRVLIVDDHAVVRNGLSSFLMIFDEFEMVGEAKHGEEAVRLCDQTRPDVILMDLEMPVMDGTTATRIIRKKHPTTQIIALTSYKEQEKVQATIQAGAIGYLLKDITAENLAFAIRQAHSGKPTLAPAAAEALIQAMRSPEIKIGDNLTEREREVLALMVEGLGNQQIAQKLFVSVSTAKTHVSSVLNKLEVSSRVEAVTLALKHNLVSKKQP